VRYPKPNLNPNPDPIFNPIFNFFIHQRVPPIAQPVLYWQDIAIFYPPLI